MKNLRRAAFSALVAFSIASPALAQQAGHGTMTPEQHSQMMAKESASALKTTAATGVVKAIDPVTRTVTIAHNPIAAKKWPAMTMTFKIGKSVLGKVKAGQRVKFSFVGEGSIYTVTKISRQ